MAEQMIKKFDVAVIGAGPGGYPAAIKAAQNGKSVALIEAKDVGGTCLNRGCIPSKALIANADLVHQIKRSELFGIKIDGFSFDYQSMIDRKNTIVSNLRKSLETLIASNGITLFRGYGRFISPKEIKITGKDSQIIYAEKIIIATGSEPREVSAFPCDGERILDSTSLLEMKTLPQSIVIIGGGVIGCEFASLYQTLGVDVTILEMLPTIISTECQSVSQALTTAFQKKGIKIYTNVTVEGIDHSKKGVIVKTNDGKSYEADIALVAVGRVLNTRDVGFDKAGILVDDKGFILVNDKMETNVDGIYAIGDITSRWWLAHVATHQGLVAASNAVGISSRMHYNAIPAIIFTEPEVGSVGLCLEKALEKGYQAVLGAFPFQALGKAQATHQTEGFAQIVIDKKTGQILGAQVVGFEAATLIAEMGVAITNELTVECLTETIHAHPTIAEVWMEAAFASTGMPLHFPPSKKKNKGG